MYCCANESDRPNDLLRDSEFLFVEYSWCTKFCVFFFLAFELDGAARGEFSICWKLQRRVGAVLSGRVKREVALVEASCCRKCVSQRIRFIPIYTLVSTPTSIRGNQSYAESAGYYARGGKYIHYFSWKSAEQDGSCNRVKSVSIIDGKSGLRRILDRCITSTVTPVGTVSLFMCWRSHEYWSFPVVSIQKLLLSLAVTKRLPFAHHFCLFLPFFCFGFFGLTISMISPERKLPVQVSL